MLYSTVPPMMFEVYLFHLERCLVKLVRRRGEWYTSDIKEPFERLRTAYFKRDASDNEIEVLDDFEEFFELTHDYGLYDSNKLVGHIHEQITVFEVLTKKINKI